MTDDGRAPDVALAAPEKVLIARRSFEFGHQSSGSFTAALAHEVPAGEAEGLTTISVIRPLTCGSLVAGAGVEPATSGLRAAWAEGRRGRRAHPARTESEPVRGDRARLTGRGSLPQRKSCIDQGWRSVGAAIHVETAPRGRLPRSGRHRWVKSGQGRHAAEPPPGTPRASAPVGRAGLYRRRRHAPGTALLCRRIPGWPGSSCWPR